MIAENIRKWPEQLRAEGYQQAQAEAEKRLQEEKQTTAKNLLAMNMMTDDQIAQVTGLEVQVIHALRQSMTQH